jgi:predicted dinucleotide-binding enzyme
VGEDRRRRGGHLQAALPGSKVVRAFTTRTDRSANDPMIAEQVRQALLAG